MNDNITLPRVVAAAITQILIDSQSVSDYQLEREEWAEKQIADALAQDDFKQEVADSALLGNIESPFNGCMHQEHCKRWKAKAGADSSLRAAVQQACDWISEEPGRRPISAGRLLAILTNALAAAPQPPTVKESLTVEQPQGELEPVGEAAFMPGTKGFTMACFLVSDVPVGTKLYTHPQPKREPLTDERIAEIACTPAAVPGSYVHSFARAIERSHGIGGEA